jgi:signal recognition particle receptor subunit beta
VSQSEELELKDQTTVALDFGMIRVNEDYVLHLYGTLGQEHFDFIEFVLISGYYIA